MSRDPYKGQAVARLKAAQSGRAKALKQLGQPTDDPKKAKRAAESAAGTISEARRDVAASLQSAKDYVHNVRHAGSRDKNDAAEVLRQAEELAASLNDAQIIEDAIKNPTSSAAQAGVREILTDKAKERAADELTSTLLEKLWQYATYHSIDPILSVVFNLPPGTPRVARWVAGAAGEAVEGIGSKFRNRYRNVDPQTGRCISPKCHNCQTGRGPCMNQR